MTDPSTTIGSSTYTDFVLAQLRVAAARASLTVVEIDSIGTALAGGFVDVDTAVEWAIEIGVLDLIATSSTIITSTPKGTQNGTTARNTGRAQSSGAKTDNQGKHGRQ
jgi:hypothetical protein